MYEYNSMIIAVVGQGCECEGMGVDIEYISHHHRINPHPS